MQQRLNQDAVIADALQDKQEGRRVLIWFALPCTCWTQWHYIHSAAASARGFEDKAKFDANLAQSRETSRQLLVGALYVLRTLLMRGSGQVHAVFEWPASCTGWRLPELSKFQELMPCPTLPSLMGVS